MASKRITQNVQHKFLYLLKISKFEFLICCWHVMNKLKVSKDHIFWEGHKFFQKLHFWNQCVPTKEMRYVTASWSKFSLNLFTEEVCLRRPQNFAKSSPYFWLQCIQSKVSWRFLKNLWPSQNIWSLTTSISLSYTYKFAAICCISRHWRVQMYYEPFNFLMYYWQSKCI